MTGQAVAKAWRSLPRGVALAVCLSASLGWGQISPRYGTLAIPDRATFDYFFGSEQLPRGHAGV